MHSTLLNILNLYLNVSNIHIRAAKFKWWTKVMFLQNLQLSKKEAYFVRTVNSS